jgi:hypothetical protein
MQIELETSIFYPKNGTLKKKKQKRNFFVIDHLKLVMVPGRLVHMIRQHTATNLA